MTDSWFDLFLEDLRRVYEATTPGGALEPWLIATTDGSVRFLALDLDLMVAAGVLRVGNDKDAGGSVWRAYWPTEVPLEPLLERVRAEYEAIPADGYVSGTEYFYTSRDNGLGDEIRRALRDVNAISYFYGGTDDSGSEQLWVRGHHHETAWAGSKSPREHYA